MERGLNKGSFFFARKKYNCYYEKQLAQLVEQHISVRVVGSSPSLFLLNLGPINGSYIFAKNERRKKYEQANLYSLWVKPKGGLWASRKNASFDWKDWCAREEFRDCKDDCSFEFIMKDENKNAVVSTLAQLRRLPHIENSIMRSSYLIDFEKCLRLGIDAIELC